MFSATVITGTSMKCWWTIPIPSVDRVRRRVDLDRLAVDQDLALVGLVQAVQDRHQRRLAGAVLAEQRVDLAGDHVEVDSVVGDDRAELLRDAPQLERRRACIRPRRCVSLLLLDRQDRRRLDLPGLHLGDDLRRSATRYGAPAGPILPIPTPPLVMSSCRLLRELAVLQVLDRGEHAGVDPLLGRGQDVRSARGSSGRRRHRSPESSFCTAAEIAPSPQRAGDLEDDLRARVDLVERDLLALVLSRRSPASRR